MPPPRGLVQQFDQFLHRTPLLVPGQRLLVACSGGADSMALLRLLHAVNQSRYWQWKLVVAHINHGLRGVRSQADQRLVHKTARALDLPCVVRRLSLQKPGAIRVSEAAARQGRLAALGALARRNRCRTVVVAHHAGDQAETVLLRILRGCSIAGLGAMRARRKAGGLEWVRPLLTFERAALETYLQDLGQPWREDHTNALPCYLRNRVRHELLPALATYQPAIRQVLVRLADQAQESYQAHQRRARMLSRRALTVRRTTATLLRAPLEHQPRIVVGMLLRHAAGRLGAGLDGLSAAALGRTAEALRAGTPGQQIQLGGELVLDVERTRGVLRRVPVENREMVRDRSKRARVLARVPRDRRGGPGAPGLRRARRGKKRR